MLAGLGVRLIVRMPLATAAFCVENCARLPPNVNVCSCHADEIERVEVVLPRQHERIACVRARAAVSRSGAGRPGAAGGAQNRE